ncbi:MULTISPECIES: hypothetical protein [unclassified Ancylobacter]|uniref:hypothetical protein n=1 Tax=unclassified Ancylobacter TaxID=2626613 RepID=UPI00226ED1C6|nr:MULTISPECIES: hypothetical protein [unclassified Ancylobacter]WAC27040.1 hypothetical protein OU996_18870 [Ancylobacter sp. SL191]WGD30632.1 hypothetical protein AncyloWKF20_01975 [Ancylobacter sp. WKF20]
MSSRFVRFDPETVALLSRCMTRAESEAGTFGPQDDSQDRRTRLAAALIEAASQGEKDEERLVDFALRVLPAYRGSAFMRM